MLIECNSEIYITTISFKEINVAFKNWFWQRLYAKDHIIDTNTLEFIVGFLGKNCKRSRNF